MLVKGRARGQTSTCVQVITEDSCKDCEDEGSRLTASGRLDLKTGTLCNFTDGGEGHAGLLRSRETTAKATATTKAKMSSNEYKLEHSARMKAAHATTKAKINLSAASKKRRADKALNEKIVEGFKASMRAKRRLKYPNWTEEDHERHERQLAHKNELKRTNAMRAL